MVVVDHLASKGFRSERATELLEGCQSAGKQGKLKELRNKARKLVESCPEEVEEKTIKEVIEDALRVIWSRGRGPYWEEEES